MWCRSRPAAPPTASARIVAQILNELTSSTFVIENRTGAGGNLSAEIVAKARPDGRTLLLGTVNTAVTNQFLYRNIAYDCELSFTPVALVAEVPNILVVHPTFPAATFEEFVHYCKTAGLRRTRVWFAGDGRHRSPDDGIPAEPGGHQAEARGLWQQIPDGQGSAGRQRPDRDG